MSNTIGRDAVKQLNRVINKGIEGFIYSSVKSNNSKAIMFYHACASLNNSEFRIVSASFDPK